MDIQNLRYIVQISEIGSINRAAQQLFVSQSTLSRAVQEMEASTGILIFKRTNKGVVTTHDGEKFIRRARKILDEVEELEDHFFVNKTAKREEMKFHLGVQWSTPAVLAYLKFYRDFCNDAVCLDLALWEDGRKNLMRLIYNQILNMGIVHCASDDKDEFLKNCDDMMLTTEVLSKCRACVQVGENHPLAGEKILTLDMLKPYPRIAFLNEDVTDINYCSDIFQYDRNNSRKRIVVQERGTLRMLLSGTDGYYVGSNYAQLIDGMETDSRIEIKCIPIEDTDISIETVLVYKKNHKFSELELQYLEILHEILQKK